MQRKIGILGCGWLGLPLGKELIRHGYSVSGSTTSSDRLQSIQAEGIEALVVRVTPEKIEGQIEELTKGADTLIISFPPGLRKDPELDFSGAIKNLSQVIVSMGVRKVVFISSISVYANTLSFKIYTEDSPPNAASRSGTALVAAEELLQHNTNFETTVLRMGGLIGAGRHPVYQLAGRKNLQDPLGPVNLIHLHDCIGIILRVLENGSFGEVFNAVYPMNPPRQQYYQNKATVLGLPVPEFELRGSSKGKVVSSSKLMRELRYEFRERI